MKPRKNTMETNIRATPIGSGTAYEGQNQNRFVLDEVGQMPPLQSIPVAPANAYYVKLKNGPWRDRLEFTDQNGEKKELYLAADFNPGENAEVTAVIASVPRRGGIPGVRVGDEIGFCYLAIYNEEVIGADPDGVFTEDEPTHPLIQTWSNKKDEILEREYLLNDRYAGRRYHAGVVVDEMKGTYGEFESWLEKVGKFREGAGKIDKNRLDWEGETYWKVETQFVYCVKRGEVVESVPGVVFCTVPEPEEVHSENGLIGVNLSTELPKRAWVMAQMPAPASGIERADLLYIRVDVAERYKFWGMDCLVVEDQYVMAGRTAPLPAAGAGEFVAPSAERATEILAERNVVPKVDPDLRKTPLTYDECYVLEAQDEPPFLPADMEDQVDKMRKRVNDRQGVAGIAKGEIKSTPADYGDDLENRKKIRRKSK